MYETQSPWTFDIFHLKQNKAKSKINISFKQKSMNSFHILRNKHFINTIDVMKWYGMVWYAAKLNNRFSYDINHFFTWLFWLCARILIKAIQQTFFNSDVFLMPFFPSSKVLFRRHIVFISLIKCRINIWQLRKNVNISSLNDRKKIQKNKKKCFPLEIET